jgi:protease I
MIGILIEDVFDEQEFIYPYYRVQEAGLEVTVIGPEADASYTSKAGFPFKADKAAKEVDASTLTGLIVPGGFAPDRMRRHPAMLKLVKDLDDAGKPLGAICHAGWVLISAGVAKGRKLTGFMSTKDDLVNAGAKYQDDRVVTDGNLVTAQHYKDLPGFMAAYLELFD